MRATTKASRKAAMIADGTIAMITAIRAPTERQRKITIHVSATASYTVGTSARHFRTATRTVEEVIKNSDNQKSRGVSGRRLAPLTPFNLFRYLVPAY